MTAEQCKRLSFIFRQVRDVVKHSIDEITELAENALSVFIEDEEANRRALPSANDEKRLLDRKELAERLNVSVRTIGELLKEDLPSVRIKTRVQFDYEEVLTWLKSREIEDRRKNGLRVVKSITRKSLSNSTN